MKQPHIVALGGTLRPQSATGALLDAALSIAAESGARTTLLTGDVIAFPNFEPEEALASDAITRFLDVLRSADGLIIGSPGYHGSLSGMVKNALDHVELLRGDERVYFDGMPVGLIATAGGWQAAVSTLEALRTIVHALRGWPTPLGVAVNTGERGDCVAAAEPQLRLMLNQMRWFLDR
ncbi:NADPH-dependent FMN reductase [Stakelama saccharophila]|uniref:NAD(P)H-dependent oxidoreductase n=1 Tax=Stakelama saccharophila TaxID=3075605 RepID=A0ABZ0BBM7_9SPHN|nr:NAD(P)H-dependent oxidoreductase [Stakelama sp. W311]WNO53709.1 NAD(P)H-dependent oxidoreductase [Stakelama sp. W311]